MNNENGYLEVGHTDDTFEVVLSHPEMIHDPGKAGGHLHFSPDQARALADLLYRHAAHADHLKLRLQQSIDLRLMN